MTFFTDFAITSNNSFFLIFLSGNKVCNYTLDVKFNLFDKNIIFSPSLSMVYLKKKEDFDSNILNLYRY
jgi:hypothetical protein